MQSYLKCPIVVGVIIALAGSVYAIPNPAIEDAHAALNQIHTTASSGSVTISTFDGNRSIVGAFGNSTTLNPDGRPATPSMDPGITVNYICYGRCGDRLIISLANGHFAHASGSSVGTSGELGNAGSSVFNGAGSYLASGGVGPHPSSNGAGPRPADDGTTSPPLSNGAGPFLPNDGGGWHSPGDGPGSDVPTSGTSLPDDGTPLPNSVPDGGMTLMLLSSALSGLALLKKMLC